MGVEAIGWTSLLLVILSAMALTIGWIKRPRGTTCRCPGPSKSKVFRPWHRPSTWLVRGSCWYNLTGLQVAADGHVRCPECGVGVQPQRLLKDGPRFRWAVLGVMSLLGACVLFGLTWLHDGAWTRPIPLVALVAMEQWGARSVVREAQCEIDRRVSNGEVAGWNADLLADKLARDLRSDARRWNAERACDLLTQMWPSSEAALEAAVAWSEPQARLLAARLLRELSTTPSDALLKACVEDLRDDRNDVGYYLSLHTAGAAADYLVRWSDRAAPHLAHAMLSGDPQQRLIAAAVAGHGGLHELIDLAAPILIEHLRDNELRGDSKVAAPALYRFGPDIIPFLEPHLDSEDTQQRAIIRSLHERLSEPDRPLHRLNNPLPRITTTTNDPLTQLTIVSSLRDFH